MKLTCAISTSPTLKTSSAWDADMSCDTVQGTICCARVLYKNKNNNNFMDVTSH